MSKIDISLLRFDFCGKRGIDFVATSCLLVFPSPRRGAPCTELQRDSNGSSRHRRGSVVAICGSRLAEEVTPCTKFTILSPVFIDTTTLVLFVFDDHSCK